MVLIGQAHDQAEPYVRGSLERLSLHCEKLQNDKGSIEVFEKALTSEDISNWFNEGNPLVLHYLAPRSLGRLALNHPLRSGCIRIMLSKWFDRSILAAICANALFLAADNPLVTSYTTLFRAAEFTFNSIFFVEFLIKLIALGGFNGKSGYFNDPWNRLDFFVLVIGWFQLLLDDQGQVANFSFFRALRILKVLKTVNNVPGLKRLVKALMGALGQLVSVSYLLIFLLLLFGIFGTQLFQGVLRLRCFPADVQAEYGMSFEPGEDLCSDDRQSRSHGARSCPPSTPTCSEFYPGTDNPNKNINPFQNFDNTLNSFLAIIIIITLDDWSSYMTQIMETRGIYASLYFIALVILGAFFVINLVVAVIYHSYTSNQNEMETKDHISLLMQTLGDSADDDISGTTAGGEGGIFSNTSFVENDAVMTALDKLEEFDDEEDDEDEEEEEEKKENTIALNSAVEGKEEVKVLDNDEEEDEEIEDDDDDESIEDMGNDGHRIQSLVHRLVLQFPNSKPLAAAVAYTHQPRYHRLKKRCHKFVSSNVFEVGIMLLILFNIAVLIVQANGAVGGVAVFANISNTVCTVLFTVELLLQIFSSSIPAFFSEGFNILDSAIVLSSLLELFFGSGTGVSAFRSLRAFRTLKLFKRSSSLQLLLFAIFQSASGLGYFCLVLALYLFLGALMGMSLFAGQLDRDAGSSGEYISVSESITNRRANFDTLFASFLTTFQIATGEGWTQILYRAMDYKPLLGAVYCIATYIFGFLCVMKLFLVIVLDTCSQNGGGEGLSYYDSLEKNQDAAKFGKAGNKVWDLVTKYFKTLTADVASASELSSIQFVNVATKQELDKASRFKHKSLWQGWSITLYWNNNRGLQLIEEADFREHMFQNIDLLEVRRGTKMFTGCFKGADLVDMLLDHGLAKNEQEALALGQELLFQKHMECLYIPPEEECLPSDFTDTARRTWSPRMQRKYSPRSMGDMTDKLKNKKFRRSFKKTLRVDPPFRDGQSLYKLNIKGEIMTEYLQQAEISEPIVQQEQAKAKFDEMLKGMSFGLFGASSAIRQMCATLVCNKHFDNVVLSVIVISSVLLALDEPGVDDDSKWGYFFFVANLCITSFFTAEMLVKMVAMTAVSAEHAYLTSGWNVLDCFIVMLSIVSVCLTSIDLDFIRALRSLRALRPLRMLSRSPGLRAIVTAVTMVLTPLLNFSLVLFVVLITFSILGTSMFRNQLHYCHAQQLDGVDYNDTNVDIAEFKYEIDEVDCHGTLLNAEGFAVALSWKGVPSNFDSIGNAIMTLMELITMSDWQLVMYPVMDIPDEEGRHPVLNNSQFNAFFFVIFIIFGSTFMNYLFVGIVVFKFTKARELEKTSDSFLTTVQMVWLKNIKSVMSTHCTRHIKPPTKEAMCGLQLPIWELVRNARFNLAIDVCICVNIIVMATEYFNQSETAEQVHYVFDLFFIVIYCIEISLRFLAVSLNTFWQNNWNRFDTLIVIGGILAALRIDLPFNVTILRVLRISRLFKVFGTSKNFQVLTRTLLYSLPALLSIVSLIFLVLFVFSVVGMNLFGEVEVDGEVFNSFQNFRHFGTSMLFLFRVITGEQWSAAMHLLRDQEGHAISFPFFVTFLVLTNFILLNLFIAVILENFDNAMHTELNTSQKHALEDFYNDWSQLHLELELPSGLNDCLPSHCLIKLVKNLAMPLGLKGHPEAVDSDGYVNTLFFVRFINSLMLKQDSSGKVYFVDVIYALLRTADKNTSASGHYTYFSMQQKHDFLLSLSRIYKKKVVKSLKKNLQHEHFKAVDILTQIQSARAIQAWFTTEKMRRVNGPPREDSSLSLRRKRASSMNSLMNSASIFNLKKLIQNAFDDESVGSCASSSGGGSSWSDSDSEYSSCSEYSDSDYSGSSCSDSCDSSIASTRSGFSREEKKNNGTNTGPRMHFAQEGKNETDDGIILSLPVGLGPTSSQEDFMDDDSEMKEDDKQHMEEDARYKTTFSIEQTTV